MQTQTTGFGDLYSLVNYNVFVFEPKQSMALHFEHETYHTFGHV